MTTAHGVGGDHWLNTRQDMIGDMILSISKQDTSLGGYIMIDLTGILMSFSELHLDSRAGERVIEMKG